MPASPKGRGYNAFMLRELLVKDDAINGEARLA